MVLGEASRDDRFSLNGYEKETNPLLKNEEVVSFSNILHVELQQLIVFLVCSLF